MREKMYNNTYKKTLVSWASCRRKPSVNVGSGITSDTVIINEGFPSFYEIKLRDVIYDS